MFFKPFLAKKVLWAKGTTPYSTGFSPAGQDCTIKEVFSAGKITANAIDIQTNKLHFAFLYVTFSYKTRHKCAYFLVSLTIPD